MPELLCNKVAHFARFPEKKFHPDFLQIIPDMKLDAATGEGRGTKIVGGVDNMLKKGDVLHIAPNTPHQSLIEPGKYFVAMVVKIHAD